MREIAFLLFFISTSVLYLMGKDHPVTAHPDWMAMVAALVIIGSGAYLYASGDKKSLPNEPDCDKLPRNKISDDWFV